MKPQQDDYLETLRTKREEVEKRIKEREKETQRSNRLFLESIKKEIEGLERIKPASELRNQKFLEESRKIFDSYKEDLAKVYQADQNLALEKKKLSTFLERNYPTIANDLKAKLFKDKIDLTRKINELRSGGEDIIKLNQEIKQLNDEVNLKRLELIEEEDRRIRKEQLLKSFMYSNMQDFRRTGQSTNKVEENIPQKTNEPINIDYSIPTRKFSSDNQPTMPNQNPYQRIPTDQINSLHDDPKKSLNIHNTIHSTKSVTIAASEMTNNPNSNPMYPTNSNITSGIGGGSNNSGVVGNNLSKTLATVEETLYENKPMPYDELDTSYKKGPINTSTINQKPNLSTSKLSIPSQKSKEYMNQIPPASNPIQTTTENLKTLSMQGSKEFNNAIDSEFSASGSYDNIKDLNFMKEKDKKPPIASSSSTNKATSSKPIGNTGPGLNIANPLSLKAGMNDSANNAQPFSGTFGIKPTFNTSTIKTITTGAGTGIPINSSNTNVNQQKLQNTKKDYTSSDELDNFDYQKGLLS